jgi:hypothetical protein
MQDRHSNFYPRKAVMDSHLFKKGKTHKTRPHDDITRKKSMTLMQKNEVNTEGKIHYKGK